MPTYEYRCPAGHEFEKLQKMSDRSRPRCPECGKPSSRKISGGAGLLFKGSGFYITDYGKDGKGPAKPPESESKPAAKETAPAKEGAKAPEPTPPKPAPKKGAE